MSRSRQNLVPPIYGPATLVTNHVNVASIHWSRREEHTHFSSPKARKFDPRSFLGIGPQPCAHAESSYIGYVSPVPILSALVASVLPIPNKGDLRGARENARRPPASTDIAICKDVTNKASAPEERAIFTTLLIFRSLYSTGYSLRVFIPPW